MNERDFECTITVEEEEANFGLYFKPKHHTVRLTIRYLCEARMKLRYFERVFDLSGRLPAELTRGLLRLGCSDEMVRRLAVVYDEALFFVPHEDLHTDTSDMDLGYAMP